MVGGIIFIRKCAESLELIRKWRGLFYENFSLVDDSPSKSPNFKGFIEHRHDQSVWSLLVKTNNIRYLSHLEQMEIEYPIIAKRDRGIPLIKRIKNNVVWNLKITLKKLFIILGAEKTYLEIKNRLKK